MSRPDGTGCWHAGRPNSSDEMNSTVYFDEVISAGLLESGDENVFRKVLDDLQYADVAIDAHAVREKMKRLLREAASSLDSAG
ncbi:ATPase inhibitor subunit zeta [Rhizobium lentis]|uniref:ATPase inhibitor subunit zeta n=1 Tax=Rhizobium lentis TaxID=1138194 RepID=UPI00287FE013|nr:ATPase inhibitor subunit zeta [Rhizobium lentis]